MSFTNTSPIMFPNRSSEIALGTNPLSCCANSEKTGDSFLLDMATTTVALGKVRDNLCRGRSNRINKEYFETIAKLGLLIPLELTQNQPTQYKLGLT